MTHFKKFLLSIFLCFILIILSLPNQTVSAKTSSSIAYVILSHYKVNTDIGNEFYIIAFTSNGKLPSFKSSNSKVASVNTYGKVTAKASGTTTITAKIKNAEASCKITVNKTKLTISMVNASMERGESIRLTATTSNNSIVSFKSNKKSIAIIDENGTITGIKPGKAIITAKADGTEKICHVTVKSPTVKLNKTNIKLYRNQTIKLSATVSSGFSPTWKSNKRSVAVVDEYGTVTAIKHGTAIITATIDGISRSCNVVVEKPIITLNKTQLSLKTGDNFTLTANVSSNLSPTWSSSNSNIVTVDQYGVITAWQKGKAYIYAADDGTKVRCIVNVTK